MPPNLTLILSIYAAFISTVGLIERILSYSKKLKVIIEAGAFDNSSHLVLVNYGKRPITIKDISLTVGIEPVPRNAMFKYDENTEITFPIVLDQYQNHQIQFTDIVSSMLTSSDLKIQIQVTDIEGETFTKFTRRVANNRWGFLEKGPYK